MDVSLSILTDLVIIIVIGILITILSKKLKISNLLLLMISGLVIGGIARNSGLLDIPYSMMITIAVLALVLIVFYGSSQFKLKSLDNFSVSAVQLTSAFLFFNIVILGLAITIFFFDGFSLLGVLYSLIFAIIVTGTDPASIFAMMKSTTHKAIELLKIEAILNTPIIVILPFIILDVILNVGSSIVLDWQTYMMDIFTQILVGLGSGIFVGIIFFKAMKTFYSEDLSPLAIITSAILSYILAENLGGNGVLAVAVLGFFFGNIYIANKSSLQAFSGMISNALEILVFILLGFIVNLQVELSFILKSLVIFILILASRYIATRATLGKKDYTPREIWYISLNMPKGIAVAVLVFSLSVLGLQQLDVINNLLILIMLYSLVLSTAVNKFSSHFISVKIESS